MKHKTVPEKVKAFLKKEKNPAELYIEDMNEIYETGGIFNIINTAFYYGYMKGIKAKKGGF